VRTVEQQFWRKGCAAALVLVALGLALTCGVTSSRWIDTPFPGFFVMANRVIASVSLPHWPVAQQSHIHHHAVVAVNGRPVATSDELYAFVQRFPPGSPLTYTLEKDGHTSQITLASLTFTFKDYFLLFFAYVFNGLALALIGIGVWFLKPAAPASRALFTGSLAAASSPLPLRTFTLPTGFSACTCWAKPFSLPALSTSPWSFRSIACAAIVLSPSLCPTVLPLYWALLMKPFCINRRRTLLSITSA
jgi:hypothetical protein